MIVFIHIPKTGGISLRNLFDKVYGDNFLQDGDVKGKLPKNIEMVGGHFRYIASSDTAYDCQYITMMRNPIERLISYYYFLLRSHDHYIYRKIIRGNSKLNEAFKKYGKDYNTADMAKMIANEVSFEDFVYGGFTEQTCNGQASVISGLNTPFGKTEDKMLEVAISNIESSFLAVGLMEKFDESVQLFGKKLGWKRIPCAKPTNVRPKLPIQIKFDKEKMEEFNRIDMKLYEYVVGRWNRDWGN